MRRYFTFAFICAFIMLLAAGCSGMAGYISAASKIPKYATEKRAAKLLIVKGAFMPDRPTEKQVFPIVYYKPGQSGWNRANKKTEVTLDQVAVRTAAWLKWYYAVADYVNLGLDEVSPAGYDYLVTITALSMENQRVVIDQENACDWPRATFRYDFYAVENEQAAKTPIVTFSSPMQVRKDSYKQDRTHAFDGSEGNFIADTLEAFFTNFGYKMFVDEVDKKFGPPVAPQTDSGY